MRMVAVSGRTEIHFLGRLLASLSRLGVLDGHELVWKRVEGPVADV